MTNKKRTGEILTVTARPDREEGAELLAMCDSSVYRAGEKGTGHRGGERILVRDDERHQSLKTSVSQEA